MHRLIITLALVSAALPAHAADVDSLVWRLWLRSTPSAKIQTVPDMVCDDKVPNGSPEGCQVDRRAAGQHARRPDGERVERP